MALSARARRALGLLAALPGLIAAGWWVLADSYLDDWRARESALESQLALYAEVSAESDRLVELRQGLTARIEVIRNAKSFARPLPDLEGLFRALPQALALEEVLVFPQDASVRVGIREHEPGEALRAAEALREAGRFRGVILEPPGKSDPGLRSLLVTFAEPRP